MMCPRQLLDLINSLILLHYFSIFVHSLLNLQLFFLFFIGSLLLIRSFQYYQQIQRLIIFIPIKQKLFLSIYIISFKYFSFQLIVTVILIITKSNLKFQSMIGIYKILLPHSSISLSLRFCMSKMANYASKAKHPPTSDMWEYGEGKTPQELKISVWNVNGLRSVIRKGQLQSYLKCSQPDIFCINETKIDLQAFKKEKYSIINSFQTQDNKWYHYFNFCKVSAGYSGVLVLVKHKPIRIIEDFHYQHYLSLEGRCLTLEYDKFFIVNCYKPNSGLNLQRLQQRTKIYDHQFTKFIKQLQKTKPVIVCGDMNVAHKEIDLANPKTSKNSPGFTIEEREAFSQFLNQTGLIDTYRHVYPFKIEYTWWSTRKLARQLNIGWRIDHILLSNPSIIKRVQIKGAVMGSDHCPVECEINFNK